MLFLARFSIRRPRLALTGWLVVVGVLSAIGFGVSSSVSPSVTAIKGTESYRAKTLAEHQFGPSQLVPILLEGPKSTLDKVGPVLVRDLVARPHTRALSAWDAGTASAGLRPAPTKALIVVSVDRSEKDVVNHDFPQIQNLVHRDTGPSVKAYVSGQPSIDRALKSEAVSTLRQAAWIGLGVLFVILLLGLRAPLGAALVTIVAAATTMSSFGIMALLGKGMTLDALALATGAIAGLARGASFSLVMLDRFHREESADPRRRLDAVLEEAVGSTGRALLFAGTVMIAALLLVDFLSTTDVLATLGIGAVLCTALATGAAVVVIPAGLELFGPAVNRRLPAPAFLGRTWDRMVGVGEGVVRHPLAFGALGAAALLALAVPALGAKSGPQDVRQLPPNNSARVAFNELARVMGPGYPTPYSVVIVNPSGPVTAVATLDKIARLEAQIAKDPAVATVVGPGAIDANAQQLKKFGPSLVQSMKISDRSKKDLLKLIDGLGQAGAGSAQLKAGLQQAVSGANQLNTGAGQAVTGAGQVHSGASQIQSGAGQLSTGLDQLSGGLNQANSGAQQLKVGSATALEGATQLLAGIKLSQGPATLSLGPLQSVAGTAKGLSTGLASAQHNAQQVTAAISGALNSLRSMTTGKSDPQYQAVLGQLNSASNSAATTANEITTASGQTGGLVALSGVLASQAPGLVAGLNMLNDGANGLQTGIRQLRNGNGQLAGGIGTLAAGGQAASTGGKQLTSALGQLTAGTQTLQTGLGQLASGTGQLAYGLAAAPNGAGQLQTGLGTMQSAVVKARGQIPSTADLKKLMSQSPGIFTSGYFILAAVQGSLPSDRNAASFTVNLLRGGNAAQMIVTSRYGVANPQAEKLGGRLRAITAAWARTNRLDVAIGGPAGSLFDIAHNARTKLPVAMLGTAIGVALLLMLLLRSILIPTIAIACAALTTAAGFGVMQLLFGGSNPPLGGPGNFDPISLTEILSALFGASLLYIVVLVTRTREHYVGGTDARASLSKAMRSTKAATSGIAALTVGVVVPFMFTELQPVRRIAVAAALSVAIMAYVIIPVVLPAAMSLAGRLGWWPTHGARPPARPKRRKLRVPQRPHLHRPRPQHM